MWDGQRFFERFVTSVSYSAYLILVRRVLPPAYVQGLVPLWVACVGLVRLRGLQDVFAMLAGQGIADLIPLPMEPSGYLIVPAVLVYLMVISSVGWGVYHALGARGAHTPMGNALSTALDQYLSLFFVLRTVRAFTEGGETHALRLLSIVYTVLRAPPSKTEDADDPGRWRVFWRRNLEGVAMRGANAWLLDDVLRPQCASAEELLALQLACIYLCGLTSRLDGVRAVLSIEAARHIMRLFAKAELSDATCVGLLTSAAALLVYNVPDQTHMFVELCAFVASLLLTSTFERWLAAVGPLEASTLYMALFCLLEVVVQQSARLMRLLTTAADTPPPKLPAEADDGRLLLLPFSSLL
jgi:hypothetical protein